MGPPRSSELTQRLTPGSNSTSSRNWAKAESSWRRSGAVMLTSSVSLTQTAPRHRQNFLRLADWTDRADGAIASRAHPASVLPVQRPVARRITSWAFSRLTRRLFRLPYSDTQCGAKVVRRQVIDGVLPLLSSRDFLFDVDLLLTADRLGYHVVEVPTVWLDQEGSHLRASADAGAMAISSLRLWFHHRVHAGAPTIVDPIGSRRMSRNDVVMVAPYPALHTESPIPSGVATYTERLTTALADEGVRVHVIAPQLHGEPSLVRARNQVTVERSFRRGPSALPAAATAASKGDAPIVHLQYETFLFGGPSSIPGVVPALVQSAGPPARAGRDDAPGGRPIVGGSILYRHAPRQGAPSDGPSGPLRHSKDGASALGGDSRARTSLRAGHAQRRRDADRHRSGEQRADLLQRAPPRSSSGCERTDSPRSVSVSSRRTRAMNSRSKPPNWPVTTSSWWWRVVRTPV